MGTHLAPSLDCCPPNITKDTLVHSLKGISTFLLKNSSPD